MAVNDCYVWGGGHSLDAEAINAVTESISEAEVGHQDALPWREGFVGQTGPLDKANDRGDGINHIYRICLQFHREVLAKVKRQWGQVS
ncbi:hypothetical protein [Sphingomonas jaspsi]|uniref:hypothetical protein n=1 Tax=Sphingomonas jaspsi TaxID=392409 RepID=UPI0004B236C6|nr:hypothetical protein [Sphingomonas jaspsi]